MCACVHACNISITKEEEAAQRRAVHITVIFLLISRIASTSPHEFTSLIKKTSTVAVEGAKEERKEGNETVEAGCDQEIGERK